MDLDLWPHSATFSLCLLMLSDGGFTSMHCILVSEKFYCTMLTILQM